MTEFAPWQEVDYRLLSGNPLPSYTSLVLSKNVVAIYTDSPTKKATWRLAGYLSQVVSLQLPAFGGLTVIQNRRLWLHQLQLIEFDPSFSTYQVSIEFPRWLTSMEIALWQTSRISATPDETEVEQQQVEKLDFNIEQIDNLAQEIQELNNLINNLQLPP